MKQALLAELRLALLPILAGSGVGALFGAAGAGLALGLAVYLAAHLRHAWRLAVWLERERAAYPPEADGLWGEIFHRLHLRQRSHRRRKRQLARLLVRFQQSTRAIPDALVVIDDQRCIEWANSAATRLLGVDGNADHGQRIENLLRHPSFVAFVRGDPARETLSLRSPVDPSLTLEMRLVAFAEGQQLLIVRDATERQRIDQMRRDFVANVSHELRTPLTVLSGYLENMERDPQAVPDMWRRPVRAMAEQSERMRRLVEDLLLLARVEASPVTGERAPVNVAVIIQALERDARDLSAGDAHHIEVEADRSLSLRGVEAELQTVFTNLVANAVQYTPAGGHIRIRWGSCGEGQACFEVSDDGEGIPAAHLTRLTERFYRVDKGRSRDRGGTGLGLSIVKHVLERHGARLEIESEQGQGSVFRCVFPASMVEHSEAPRAASA